ncbi:MAG: hypothetical protein WBP08_05670 [Saprospiraceae bacterium]
MNRNNAPTGEFTHPSSMLGKSWTTYFYSPPAPLSRERGDADDQFW